MYPFFQHLSESSVNRLFHISDIVEVPANTVLIQEGELHQTFFWIEQGLCSVHVRSHPKPLTYVGVGEVLGEVAFVSRKPAVATVRTEEPTTLRKISFAKLEEALEQDSGFAADFYYATACILADRLRHNLKFLPQVQMPTPLADLLSQLQESFLSLERKLRKKHEAQAEKERTRSLFFRFHDLLNQLYHDPDLDRWEKESLKRQIAASMLPYILITDTQARAFTKPRGYAGDYLTIQKIYTRETRASSPLGRFLDQCALEIPAARAVRNRRAWMREAILEKFHTSPHRPYRVVSLACGPAEEWWDLLRKNPDIPVEFHALDVDKAALRYVEAQASRLGVKVHCHHQNLLRIVFGQERFTFPKADLIYSIGLIDYFPDRFVVRLLHRIHAHLRDGGWAILGNFHPRNPSRAFMEWLLDWKLIHRSEQTMVEIVRQTPFQHISAIAFEPENINLFVLLQK